MKHFFPYISRRFPRALITAAATVLSLGATAFGYDGSTINLVWNPPESGAHHYRLEITAFDSTDSETIVSYAYTLENKYQIELTDDIKYEVRIQAVDANGIRSDYSDKSVFSLSDVLKSTDVEDEIPTAVALMQNAPNPFNPSTTISYMLPRESHVSLTIFNMAGQKIAELEDGMVEAGSHSMVWNAADMPTGVYFYRLVTNGFSESKKMMLLK